MSDKPTDNHKSAIDYYDRALDAAAAIKARMDDNAIRYGLDRLLAKLVDWVRVYPFSGDVEMPEHDIGWAAGTGGEGPGQVIRNAMKTTPALWLGAIPEGHVIVRRDALIKSGMPEYIVEYLSRAGSDAVLSQAARLQHEEMEAQYRERWK